MENKKCNGEIHILMGLPGSGKSTWASLLRQKNATDVYVVNMDDRYMNENGTYKTIPHICKNVLLCHHLRMGTKVIFDGLFPTNDIVAKTIIEIGEWLKLHNFNELPVKVKVHHWKENREQCIINDKFRNRDKNAESTIKNIDYDNIDIQHIRNKVNWHYMEVMEPEYHQVPVITEFEMAFDPLSYDDEGKFCSNAWVLSGEAGNCWGESWAIEPERQPDFIQLDDMLEKVAPSITHLQYRKLFRECVGIKEYTEYGYYGSYENKACYTLDVTKCRELLQEWNYIQ